MPPSNRDNAEERMARIEMLLKQQRAKAGAAAATPLRDVPARSQKRAAKARLVKRRKQAVKKR